MLEAQIALARAGISSGCIDGGMNENLRRALLAWQIHNSLPVSGELDAESKIALKIEEPLFISYAISPEDLGRIMKVPSTWLAKSEQKRLDYESILELIAEKGRATTAFIKKLNPQVNWTNVVAGTLVKIPRIENPPREKAAFARVHLYSKTLDVFGKSTNLVAHFPCSIARELRRGRSALFMSLKPLPIPVIFLIPRCSRNPKKPKKLLASSRFRRDPTTRWEPPGLDWTARATESTALPSLNKSVAQNPTAASGWRIGMQNICCSWHGAGCQ